MSQDGLCRINADDLYVPDVSVESVPVGVVHAGNDVVPEPLQFPDIDRLVPDVEHAAIAVIAHRELVPGLQAVRDVGVIRGAAVAHRHEDVPVLHDEAEGPVGRVYGEDGVIPDAVYVGADGIEFKGQVEMVPVEPVARVFFHVTRILGIARVLINAAADRTVCSVCLRTVVSSFAHSLGPGTATHCRPGRWRSHRNGSPYRAAAP